MLFDVMYFTGYEWIGWKNDSRSDRENVKILFEFDQLRSFTFIHVHSNNLITKGVQVSGQIIQ